jgi:hypothetical protein
MIVQVRHRASGAKMKLLLENWRAFINESQNKNWEDYYEENKKLFKKFKWGYGKYPDDKYAHLFYNVSRHGNVQTNKPPRSNISDEHPLYELVGKKVKIEDHPSKIANEELTFEDIYVDDLNVSIGNKREDVVDKLKSNFPLTINGQEGTVSRVGHVNHRRWGVSTLIEVKWDNEVLNHWRPFRNKIFWLWQLGAGAEDADQRDQVLWLKLL